MGEYRRVSATTKKSVGEPVEGSRIGIWGQLEEPETGLKKRTAAHLVVEKMQNARPHKEKKKI